jgi:ATP-dependent RNA helicase DDX6/DHH1
LVPTRELALQTAHVLKDLGKFLNLQIMTSTGGTDLKDDVMRLSKTVHIIVATPGRIHDLGQKGIARLDQCSHLVMDEVGHTAIYAADLPEILQVAAASS